MLGHLVRWVLVGSLGGAFACGPVESTSIQWQVESRLRRAEKLGAERHAPYEWTAANRYLKKGKEEAGYADFETAIDYLHKARALAKQAEEKSEAASKVGPPAAPLTAPSSPRR
jgi:hypothetical protein